jgi:uncharacterized protein YkwD
MSAAPLAIVRARRVGLAAAAVVLLLPVGLSLPAAQAAGSDPAPGGTSATMPAVKSTTVSATQRALGRGWRQVMLARVNAVRAAAGVAPVRGCGPLRRSAQGYAGVMASTNTYGHTGPDGSLPWDRIRAQGYAWRTAAEDIAAGQASIDEVMRGWISSPGHYVNLVNPDFRHIGFGYALNPKSTYTGYWVLDLGAGGGC